MLLCACAPESTPVDSAGGPTCDDPDHKLTFVVSTLAFTESEEDGSAWGFDLDGDVTDQGDSAGCGKQDLLDPDGTPGIDNAFVALMPIIENSEAAAIKGLVQDAVDNGELLILFEISGVDDPMNDDCVTVSMSPGLGTPMMGTDGLMLDHQSFSRDPDQAPVVMDGVALVDGHLESRGFALTLELQVLNAPLAFAVQDGAMRVDIAPDGESVSGHFGGGFSVDYVMEVVDENAVDDTLTELLRTVLPLTADLDGEAGECRYLSIDFQYQAIPAFFYGD